MRRFAIQTDVRHSHERVNLMDIKPVRRSVAFFLRLFLIPATILAFTTGKGFETGEVKAASVEGSLGSWEPVSSPVSGVLYSVSMTSASNGWAVGENGTILHWNGSAWSTTSSPTGLDLYVVKMISQNDGWAAGEFGVILHWDGVSWNPVDSPTSANIYSMDFLSSSEGWAVGFESPCANKRLGTILKWNGSEWSSIVDSLDNFGYRTVEAISSDNVWAIGTYQDATCPPGVVYYPQILDIAHWDGQVWSNEVKSQCNNWVNSLALLPDTTGWAVGTYGCVLAFDNGVVSWVSGVNGDYTLISVDIVDANDAWTVGRDGTQTPNTGVILHWAGSTWEEISNPGSNVLWGVHMISANEGWAVGEEGTILHYTNFQYTYVYLPMMIRQE
jgi:photosystem II stability/assembly factor-like uncharacterized protein